MQRMLKKVYPQIAIFRLQLPYYKKSTKSLKDVIKFFNQQKLNQILLKDYKPITKSRLENFRNNKRKS